MQAAQDHRPLLRRTPSQRRQPHERRHQEPQRGMAGEYSRELSTKVFAGQCRLITLGYRQGGTPGYGLRRQLLDQHGQPKAILATGERKSFQMDRVILTPGPEVEVATVRRIYQLFTVAKHTEAQIAAT